MRRHKPLGLTYVSQVGKWRNKLKSTMNWIEAQDTDDGPWELALAIDANTTQIITVRRIAKSGQGK